MVGARIGSLGEIPTYKVIANDGQKSGQATLAHGEGGPKTLITARHVVAGGANNISPFNRTGSDVKVEKYLGNQKVGETRARSVLPSGSGSIDIAGLKLENPGILNNDPGALVESMKARNDILQGTGTQLTIPDPKTGGRTNNRTAGAELIGQNASNPAEIDLQVTDNPDSVGSGNSGGPVEEIQGGQRVLRTTVERGVPGGDRVTGQNFADPSVFAAFQNLEAAVGV